MAGLGCALRPGHVIFARVKTGGLGYFCYLGLLLKSQEGKKSV